MNKILRVKCPQCETAFSYYESENRPFCTERCKLIDLGHWFEESYRVPEKNQPQLSQNNNEFNQDEEDAEAEGYEQSYQKEEYDENDYE